VIRAALVAAVVLGGCTPLPPTAVAYVPTRANAVCAITEVVDGDTLRLSCTEGRGGTVRLVGFDTPETYRPGCAAEKARGEMAKRFLEAHLRQARVIRPDYQGKDKYKRLLVRFEVMALIWPRPWSMPDWPYPMRAANGLTGAGNWPPEAPPPALPGCPREGEDRQQCLWPSIWVGPRLTETKKANREP